jgi:chemotaxis protein histidine kinase CheA
MKESKFFVDLIKKEAPKARVAIVANKQDLPGALTPQAIAEQLGYRTYPLIAIDPNQRGAMLNIVAEVVEVTSGVTSLIQPMLEREALTEAAETAIMQGNLLKASEIYKHIAELSENLGEDDMAGIFLEQSKLLARQVQAAAQQIQEKKLVKPTIPEALPRVELPTEVRQMQPSESVPTTPINPFPSKPPTVESPIPSLQPPQMTPTPPSTSDDAEKMEIEKLEQELVEINNVIKEVKQEARDISEGEFEKEMVQLENRKNQIHKKIMELRMNIIKKLAV